MAKCPSCKKDIDKLDVEEISVPDILTVPHRAIAFTCPQCQCIIKITTIPITQRVETTDE